MKRKFKFYTTVLFSIVMLFSFESCNKSQFSNNRNVSSATGWDINSKKGGFQYNTNFKGQDNPPNMVLIDGGTYTKGRVQDDPMRDWNNTANQQHVQSFYMDVTEVTNVMYLEYLDWLKRNRSMDVYLGAIPDTLVWRNKLGYAEDMVNNYLRNPAYANYPVVGVKWIQATEYAEWRSDRYQELILEKEGFIVRDAKLDSVNNNSTFNIDTYVINPNESYGGNQEILRGKRSRTPDSLAPSTANRESGYISPKFRLPTESEWEYAALGLKEVRDFNVYRGRKKYPWQGQYTRTGQRKNLGDQLANFKNSDGDYGGIAGWSDDGADITNQVASYDANSFGLYDMAGNVAEWVADVYRPIIDEEMNDFNYYRGNIYYRPSIDENGKVQTFNNENADFNNLPGSLKNEIENEDSIDRTNYSKGDNRDFNDGDRNSVRDFKLDGDYSEMYNSPNGDNPYQETTTLINNEARVYKGGSWLDRAYYLDPAQRRYYPESMTSNFIGFRCAMSYLGESRVSKNSRKRK